MLRLNDLYNLHKRGRGSHVHVDVLKMAVSVNVTRKGAICFFHLVLTVIIGYGLTYDVMYVNLPYLRQTYGGRWKFLTFWNMVCTLTKSLSISALQLCLSLTLECFHIW